MKHPKVGSSFNFNNEEAVELLQVEYSGYNPINQQLLPERTNLKTKDLLTRSLALRLGLEPNWSRFKSN
jgi:hypothetical protein